MRKVRAVTTYSFLEFFAGGGMAREGLGADWRCLFANDCSPAKAAAYGARWGADGKPPAELLVRPVEQVGLTDLPAQRADLAWASFPCQDLSVAGVGAGLSGERSGSFMPFWMLISSLRGDGRAPRAIVLENVCGLLTSNGGQDFGDICRMLQLGGYRFGAMVIDAIDFVPQSRPRLFIVAVDRDLSISGARAASAQWHNVGLVTAQERLRGDLKHDWIWFDPPAPPKRNSRFVDLIEANPTDVPWHSAEQTARLLAMMSDINRLKVDRVIAAGERAIGGIYKRTRVERGRKYQRAEIRFDDVAGCLRTPGGGSSRQQIMLVEHGEVRTRLISARETARLMGLPDDYPLPLRYNDAYHLTGDGVVVPVVRHIAEWILEPVLDEREQHRVAA